MLIKRPLLHQSTGPCVCVCVCVCVSLSLSFRLIPEFTFLPRLLRPSREGALCLHPIERAPEAFMNRASPVPGALLAFCINQGISASFSPLLSYRRLRTTRFRSIKGPQQTGSLACCNPWGRKKSDTTEQRNCTELNKEVTTPAQTQGIACLQFLPTPPSPDSPPTSVSAKLQCPTAPLLPPLREDRKGNGP